MGDALSRVTPPGAKKLRNSHSNKEDLKDVFAPSFSSGSGGSNHLTEGNLTVVRLRQVADFQFFPSKSGQFSWRQTGASDPIDFLDSNN